MTVSCPNAVMNSLVTFYCELVHFCDALVVLLKRLSYKKCSYIVKLRDSLNLSNGNHLICHMTIKVYKKWKTDKKCLYMSSQKTILCPESDPIAMLWT